MVGHTAGTGLGVASPHRSGWLRRAGVGGQPLPLLEELQALGASVAAEEDWSWNG